MKFSQARERDREIATIRRTFLPNEYANADLISSTLYTAEKICEYIERKISIPHTFYMCTCLFLAHETDLKGDQNLRKRRFRSICLLLFCSSAATQRQPSIVALYIASEHTRTHTVAFDTDGHVYNHVCADYYCAGFVNTTDSC